MGTTKTDLNRWSLLPISLAGRINTDKMSVLPRFLFLFQNVPLFIPKSFFKELDKHLSSFIWNKSIPRIRKAFLERQNDVGGLALPNFMYYYWLCDIDKLIYWAVHLNQENTPVWVEMDQYLRFQCSVPRYHSTRSICQAIHWWLIP